jgi:hypothetical protein
MSMYTVPEKATRPAAFTNGPAAEVETALARV